MSEESLTPFFLCLKITGQNEKLPGTKFIKRTCLRHLSSLVDILIFILPTGTRLETVQQATSCHSFGSVRSNLQFCFMHRILQIYETRVPTCNGKTGKPGKMGMHFPVREKSGNFEQTGKVRENHTKYWKTEGISEKIFFNDI